MKNTTPVSPDFTQVAERLIQRGSFLTAGEVDWIRAQTAALTPSSDLDAWLQPGTALLNDPEQLKIRVIEQGEPAATRIAGLPRRMFAIMKATRLCNLRCKYCNAWRAGPNQVMTFEVLAQSTREILQSGVPCVDFVWHGGEVTLLDIDFFRKARWLQTRYQRPGQEVSNSIQTNATILTDEWAQFFRENKFAVGVSLDAMATFHDENRLDVADKETWSRVLKGLGILRRNDVEFGLLVVVTARLAACDPAAILSFLASTGSTGVSFVNVIPDNKATDIAQDPHYLPFSEYVAFLQRIHGVWRRDYSTRLRVRELDALEKLLIDGTPRICVHAGHCMGEFLTVEPDGMVAACDKYVGDPNYTFGTIAAPGSLARLYETEKLAAARQVAAADTANMKACPFFSLCNGGCPHDNRLSKIFDRKWAGNCCGLGPLLEDIRESLPRREPSVT